MARPKTREMYLDPDDSRQERPYRQQTIQTKPPPSRKRSHKLNTCKHYNKSTGCKNGDNCSYLHVCRHYIVDDCKFGRVCSRSHEINSPQVIGCLREQGIDIERLDLKRHLKRIFCERDGKSPPPSPPPQGSLSSLTLNDFHGQKRQRDSAVICHYHLQNKCVFGAKCRNHHKDLPYQWQLCCVGDCLWHDVETDVNVEFESNFCNVKKKKCTYYHKNGSKITVYFEKTNGENFDSSAEFQFRRLSTPPYRKGKICAFATSWIWYWRTDKHKWEKFGNGNGENINDDDLERKFLENPNSRISFTKGTTGRSYKIDFIGKSIVNPDEETERRIRRRPVFFTPEDFKAKKDFDKKEKEEPTE